MSHTIKIKRGLNIPLEGAALGRIETIKAQTVGIVPDDFEGHAWKCAVKPGDKTAVGTPLLFDKKTGSINIVSPINGEVTEVRRGERRKITAVVVKATSDEIELPKFDLSINRDSIIETLKKSGLWAMMRERPFDIVPDPDSIPRDIFITAFDSAPLAPAMYDSSRINIIEKGLEVLGTVTGKKPYISFRAGSELNLKNGEVVSVEGPHPAGNVGVQIAAIKPVNKGETVWTLNVSTLLRIGKLYLDNKLNWITTVALTGPEMPDPHMVETTIGVEIKEILHGIENKRNIRIISGNVLTGKKVSFEEGFLRYPYYQITIIEEGNERDEFMGWASMNPKKYSVKRTFPAFIRGLSKPFAFDARVKGGRRAMILSGEYDKVFPFDIYPEYLVRAMEAGDIDKMEKLGIYEVAPEDFALPEFVDTSKIELQQLVRDSLDKIRNEE